MTSRGGSTLTWYSYDLPNQFAAGTKTATFSYGVDRARYKQVQQTGGTTDATIYYAGGLFEAEAAGSTTTYRHYVRVRGETVAMLQRVGTTNTLEYLHRDHQSSIVAVTGPTGTLVRPLAFDVGGLRRDPSPRLP